MHIVFAVYCVTTGGTPCSQPSCTQDNSSAHMFCADARRARCWNRCAAGSSQSGHSISSRLTAEYTEAVCLGSTRVVRSTGDSRRDRTRGRYDRWSVKIWSLFVRCFTPKPNVSQGGLSVQRRQNRHLRDPFWRESPVGARLRCRTAVLGWERTDTDADIVADGVADEGLILEAALAVCTLQTSCAGSARQPCELSQTAERFCRVL